MFCGDRGVQSSGEDVFPMWLQNKLKHFATQHHPSSDPRYMNCTYSDLAAFQDDIAAGSVDAADGRSVTGARPAAYKLPDVSASWNNGWMGRLEDAATRVMPGLIEGKAKSLAPFDQLILATWMVKTCLTYDAAREPSVISASVGSYEFFRNGVPRHTTFVAVGHDPDHVMEGALAHGRMHVEANPLLAPSMEAAIFTFQFDRLLLHASINISENMPHREMGVSVPLKAPYFERIWPQQGRFLWPSEAARLSPDTLVPPPEETPPNPLSW